MLRALQRSAVAWVRPLLAAAVSLALAAPLWAQCAMCREAAGSQKAAAIEALNRGILLLAVPPAVILAGMIWITYRYWNAAPDRNRRPAPWKNGRAE